MASSGTRGVLLTTLLRPYASRVESGLMERRLGGTGIAVGIGLGAATATGLVATAALRAALEMGAAAALAAAALRIVRRGLADLMEFIILGGLEMA